MNLKNSAEANASDFLQKIEQATSALLAERQRKVMAGGKVSGGLVELYSIENLAVIGDLHGDSESLYTILDEINYKRFLANPANKLVFLGDYVDRGSDSIGVLYAVCHLKYKYPDSVVLMRGNHESPAEFPFSSHDLPYRIQERFGDRDGRLIYNKLLFMFKLLTLATVVQRMLLLVHGGLPTDGAAGLELIATAQENHIYNSVLEELLWNDPRQIDGQPGWETSRRGIGRHFGSSVSKRWLEATGTKVVLRGHEPCQGFRIDHDNMVLTLFSCRQAYPNFKAAYLMLSADQLAGINNAKDLALYVRKL